MALSCMKESEMGPAEKARKVNLKNQSMAIGLICILLTAACSFVLVLPWSRWCRRRNHFRGVFEEAILEQTELILWKEMGKAAADYVAKSLGELGKIDFACPCTSTRNVIHCYSYMVLPSLIIISLILWNDKRIGRLFRYTCYHSSIKEGRCRGRFCFEFFIYFLQAASSGFLWCGSVLVDGDWYVCCGAGASEESMALSCMKESEMGPAEKARKVNLKNQSMAIGLICILLTAACSFVLVLPWSRWCRRRNHFREVFEEAILEQTELILWKEMGKAAADYVAKSLASLSPATTTTTPSIPKDPEKVQKTEEEEKILLNINVNWEKVACLADVLIDSIPNNLANNDNV